MVKILSTNGSGRTNEVMAEIYGMKVAKDLVHISVILVIIILKDL